MKSVAINKGRTKQKKKTRIRIINAAKKLMSDNSKVSIEEVAEEAQVSRATIYRYFTNIDLLCTEASLDINFLTPVQLYDKVKDRPLDECILFIQNYYNKMAQEHELIFRRYLSATLLESFRSKNKIRGARRVEAMTLADKIVVLKDGLIQQVGTPLSLYDDPENVFVAGFIGSPTINFVRGDINGSKLSIPSLKSIKLEIDKSVASSYSEILIGLRPQHLTLAESGDLEVEFTEALGDISYIYLKTPNGERIVVESREEKLPSTGTLVGVEAKASKALFFDPKTELRIK